MSEKRPWSENRPQRPDMDPMLKQLRARLREDKRTNWAKANVSGLAPSTIKNLIDGTTRHPQGTTLQMAYRMLGYRLVPTKLR